MMDIFEKIYPFVAYNQEAKSFYYNMEKDISKIAVAAVVIILLCLGVITRNVDSFIVGLFLICSVVTVGFCMATVYKKCKNFIDNIRTHR